MSDNHRQYHTIRKALRRCYPFEPEGRQARHLNTLAALVSGIVSSKRPHLSQIAQHVPDSTLVESREKRFGRFIGNERIDWETYFMPYAMHLLASLGTGPLTLVMDASAVGRGCATLMLSVVYQQRALPLAWVVSQGAKGHFDQTAHCALVDQVQSMLPERREIIFLGDGEFDGLDLLAHLQGYGWQYVCRTANNRVFKAGGLTFSFKEMELQPGQCRCMRRVDFTHQAYGPVQLILWWEQGHKAPIYLVTNTRIVSTACRWYQKRWSIETFFSDQKSRGFHLHKSHLANPQRLMRLMMAACLAYIWMIYLGCMALVDGWVGLIHRNNRCDWSLFQLGMRLYKSCINETELERFYTRV